LHALEKTAVDVLSAQIGNRVNYIVFHECNFNHHHCPEAEIHAGVMKIDVIV